MKTLLIFIFCNLLLSSVSAQAKKQKLENKVKGLKNFNQIMTTVNNYFEEEKKEKTLDNKIQRNDGGEEEFESEELFWARWGNFYRSRLKPNGDIEDVNAKNVEAWQSVNNKYGTTQKSSIERSGSDASWIFAGPFSDNYVGGNFRGTARIQRIEFHPTNANILFACAPNGGLWKSTNNGNSWNCLTDNFPINAVSSVAISKQNPNKMYIITGDGNRAGFIISNNSCGIWVTLDGGINWTPTNFSFNSQNTLSNGVKIVVDPTDDNIILASTESCLFRSSDGGNNWTTILSTKIFDIEFDPSDNNIVYATSGVEFLKSTDNGINFPLASAITFSGANRIEIAVSPNNSNYVYLLCGPYVSSGGTPAMYNSFRGIYRSNNKGGTFSLRTNTPNVLSSSSTGTGGADGDQSAYDLAIAVNPTNAEEVFVAGKIIWRSTNGGTTFINNTPFSEGGENIATPPTNYVHPDIQDLAFNPLNNTLYTCTDGGVYKTTDAGVNWISINKIGAANFYRMDAANYNSIMIAGGTQDNGLKLKNSFADFYHIKGADGYYCSFGNNSSVGFYTSRNNILNRFDNSGTALSIVTPARTSFFPIILADPVNSNTVYVASGPNFANVGTGLRKSTNNGITWALADSLYPTGADMINLAISSANANRLYLLTGSGLFRTDNANRVWSADLTNNTGFGTSTLFTDVATCPTNSDRVYVTLGGYTANQKVFCSNDAGASWINISGTLPAAVKVNCVTVDDNNNVYIGTDMGVYYQAVSASDWTPFYNNLPRVVVTGLKINTNDGLIRASTYGRGIWETNLFSTCDADYIISGPIQGQKFYQASNRITTAASLAGNELTNVTAKAGNEILLADGFTVPERNRFNGIIGACETGPVFTGRSTIKSNNPKSIPNFLLNIDKGDNTALYIYGQVLINNTVKENTFFTINAFKEGAFKVQIVNANEEELVPATSVLMKKDEIIKKEIHDFNLPKGKHYIQLYYEGKLVHVQELILN